MEKFGVAMRNNGSYSATLDMKLPMMMEGNFEPHFSVKHMLKDVVIASRLARAFGIEFGATDASRHGLTEEMRQGRGDEDYSSLFRQYFPVGSTPGQPSNGEDDQPSLAGIDQAQPAVPEKIAEAVETKAEVPSEAKAMGEVVPAPAVVEAPVEPTEKSEAVVPAVNAPLASEIKTEGSSPAPVSPEPAPAAKPAEVSEPKAADAPILTFPTPLKEGEETEEPRGLWGGFWRRRTDD